MKGDHSMRQDTRQDALAEMLRRVKDGRAVLTAGEIHPDIPRIHDVGHRDGCRLQTSTQVGHHGFGFFSAKVNGDLISFDAGGAMNRATDGEKYSFSWTDLRASAAALDALGYDLDAAQRALEHLHTIQQRSDERTGENAA